MNLRTSMIGVMVTVMAVSLSSSLAGSAPSTATFMNVMTVCGVGSKITIDSNLQGSMTSLYEKEATKGRAVQEIVVEIAKLLPQGDTYAKYLDCVKSGLSAQ
jgi:hypothetical protein